MTRMNLTNADRRFLRAMKVATEEVYEDLPCDSLGYYKQRLIDEEDAHALTKAEAARDIERLVREMESARALPWWFAPALVVGGLLVFALGWMIGRGM